MKKNGDIIEFIKKKEYIMLNNNLGNGSFGKTVLLKDESIDELFVAKKYEPQGSDDKKEFYTFFVEEIKIMHKLFHKNLVRIYNYYLYSEEYTGFILMEYIDGKKIDEYIADEYDSFFGDLEIADKIFVQLLEAFNFLEQNKILHRDIRENNILVDKKGIVKIIDFGLGKIVHPIVKSTDSKDGIINRYNMAKHPSEFNDGKYTHQTDMFCIAELFERILNKNNIKEFSYFKILERMTKINPKDRFKTFQEIIDLINKKQFELMEIEEEDKIVYQKFSNAVMKKIGEYTIEPCFETDIDKIIKGLNKIIEVNSLENYIQFNDKLIRVFVISNFSYYIEKDILCEIVNNFYKWFTNISKDYQKMVINNFILKLSTIKTKKIEEPDDLPF